MMDFQNTPFDSTVWNAQLQDALAKTKVPDASISLVLYTDGGCQPVPRGQGGWGIHGYYYIHQAPKQGQGCKGFGPTPTGYVNGIAQEETVTVVGYVDACGSIMPNSTNNEAELVAFTNALRIVIETRPVACRLVLDSRYVLDAVTNDLETWAARGWRKSDGNPVANVERWKVIRELLNEAHTLSVLSWDWTKGHGVDVGNNIADRLATAGVYAGNKGHDHERYTLSPSKKYWAPEANYNRFLMEGHWYFNTASTGLAANLKHLYHMGNHGSDDDDLGKPIADTTYSVVMVSSPDPVLEQIRALQSHYADGHGIVVDAKLNNIFKPRVYDDILKHRSMYLRRAETRMDIYDPGKVQLTRVAFPAKLAFRAIDALAELEELLVQYDADALPDHHCLREITDVIYEEVVVKDEPTYKVRLGNGQEAVAVKVPVDYSIPSGLKGTTDVVLTVGIDTPKRNFFAAVASQMPKVYVLSWPEPCSGAAFRYAVIVETITGECGIWAGAYANLRIVS